VTYGANSVKASRRFRGIDKDVRDLIRKLSAVGVEVDFTGKGHLVWQHADAPDLVTSGTARTPAITVRKVRSWCRRNGIES